MQILRFAQNDGLSRERSRGVTSAPSSASYSRCNDNRDALKRSPEADEPALGPFKLK